MISNMAENIEKPHLLFEVSWEVCNKVGGIHTVISTKALTLSEKLQNEYILIGPDVWRDEIENPEFIPDPLLFKDWKERAESEGLLVKTGRWNISGKPMVILVDFYNFISQKDDIFKIFWEKFKLDSISGQWDYIEPALFGYASAKVIDSFVNFNMGYYDRVVAQFHEWMTGTGVLYLHENAPGVGTVFTTHATVLGRSIAGNNRPLYSNLQQYNSQQIAREFNIISKQSLEKISAQTADAFTTVSEITSKECNHFLGKKPDIVTPNGFEDNFVPVGDEYERKRKQAREKLIKVAGSVFGYEVPGNALLVAISGRYEFKNKGIDLFIDSLAKLNRSNDTEREILAFILIPANNYGPREEVLRNLSETGKNIDTGEPYLTHGLHDSEFDPILAGIKKGGLKNSQEDKVRVVFVPSYLQGDDGIFNETYYDLLIGFDLTLFPSYYEPWGYTPLESLAFCIPTVTTSLAGFGSWVKNHFPEPGNGILVVDRTDDNDEYVVESIINHLKHFSALSLKEENNARKKAFEISRIALWNNLVDFYFKAYQLALEKAGSRIDTFEISAEMKPAPEITEHREISRPIWKKLYVGSKLPEELEPLNELSKNLWWSWNTEAEDLFKAIDPVLWEECAHNPVTLLEKVDYRKILVLGKDKNFTNKLNNVYKRFCDYLDTKPPENHPKVAYFSMEYGLHESLRIFSGGLGILAGDYLKEASDSNFTITGIGLLYRYGYFKQILSVNGEQHEIYDPEHYSKLPLIPVKDENGIWKTISIVFPGRTVTARIWEVKIGRVSLYLLDTDHENNLEKDRFITHHLYGGDKENRLKQELLLGIGGIRVLRVLGINADLFHSNEGHSAFIGLERLRILISENNLSFPEALEVVRASTLFTTHTPVPAGHDAFDENLLRTYIAHYPERLKIIWDELMALGRSNPGNRDENFNMSYLAARLSQEINAVSKLHGDVTREIFSKLWPGYLLRELHIGYVTNGVHYSTWVAREWPELYQEMLGKSMVQHQSEKECWEEIYKFKDEVIWKTKQNLKSQLISYVKERFRYNWIRRHENPKHIGEITRTLNDKALTIGFARRFATYKRANLIFKDVERLAKIVNNPDKPVQFLFAGKAHPKDGGGKGLIKKVFELSKRPEFLGKILFLQNYDMDLAKKLVQGVDIWLNTPTRPMEASGTSGEKAVMNGTLHFSVLDGWWVEGYVLNAGWAISEKRTYENQDFQDELDAETIYHLLENEIIPAFYDRNEKNIPVKWVGFIKNSMAKIAPNYTMKRMFTDYREQFYNKLFDRTLVMRKNHYAMAKRLASWKKKICRSWKDLEVISVDLSTPVEKSYKIGEEYNGIIIIDLKNVPASQIGLELVVSDNGKNESPEIIHKQEFTLEKVEEGKAYFKAKIIPTKPGSFTFGFRLFPKHPDLPYKQDCDCVKWI